MPTGWLTNHPLTESDGSIAKCTMKDKENLDVCTLDGQQRRSMTFEVARVKKGSGISRPSGEEREQACFYQDAVEKTCLTSRTNKPLRRYGCDRKTVCTSWT